MNQSRPLCECGWVGFIITTTITTITIIITTTIIIIIITNTFKGTQGHKC